MQITQIIEEQMASTYTKHLAQAMGNTKDVMMANLFNQVYMEFDKKLFHLVMPKRGNYEVWQGDKRVAKRIKHRKEAQAIIKLLKGNENDE